MGGVVDTLLFQPPTPPTPIRLAASTGGGKRELVWLTTVYGSKIPALFLQRKCAIYTILYSHGNAEDLGMLSSYLSDLSKILHVNILAYDYTGYGFSNRHSTRLSRPIEMLPSEQHCYADICAAFDFLVRIRGIPPRHVILFGRSIGSGPSCYLASKLNVRERSLESDDIQCNSCAHFVDDYDSSLECKHFKDLADANKQSEYIGGIILHSPFTCKYFVDLAKD
jgi:pimeloyl-ACP methyl ester carboxylesterase